MIEMRIESLNRLGTLSFAEWCMLGFALLALPCVALSLRQSGFSRTRARLSRLPALRRRNPAGKAGDASSLARMVTVAARRGPMRFNCLTQSVLLEWLLRRQAIPATLRIGAKRDDGALSAHAWVEVNGVPLNDTPAVTKTFRAFDGHA